MSEFDGLREELNHLERENAHLRLIHARFGCPYGHGDPVRGCSLGYPGCACADDIMAMASWSPEDEDKAAVRLGRRLRATEHVLSRTQAALHLAANTLEERGRPRQAAQPRLPTEAPDY